MDKQSHLALDFKMFQKYDLRVNSGARRSAFDLHDCFNSNIYKIKLILSIWHSSYVCKNEMQLESLRKVKSNRSMKYI